MLCSTTASTSRTSHRAEKHHRAGLEDTTVRGGVQDRVEPVSTTAAYWAYNLATFVLDERTVQRKRVSKTLEILFLRDLNGSEPGKVIVLYLAVQQREPTFL